MSQSRLSRIIRGYQSSPDRDSHDLARWLGIRSLDPTGDTATHRIDKRSA